MMRIVVVPFVFLWNFIVGDQPWLALGAVVVGVVTLGVRHDSGGWLAVPIVVAVVLTLVLLRDVRRGYSGHRRLGRKGR
ncbi:hypothetical protein [Ferrimicrobium sp.]|uniref:hypothetical protein n=1 Tax=Ferrimicrobium sp. TaxID=2926050 RepID=UPI002636B6D9|nr:hypothetical protein [Ferrimicrobium sp.]